MCWAGVLDGRVLPLVWFQAHTAVNGEWYHELRQNVVWSLDSFKTSCNSMKLLVSARWSTVSCQFGILEVSIWWKSYQPSHFFSVACTVYTVPISALSIIGFGTLWKIQYLIRSHQTSLRAQGSSRAGCCFDFFNSGEASGRQLQPKTRTAVISSLSSSLVFLLYL